MYTSALLGSVAKLVFELVGICKPLEALHPLLDFTFKNRTLQQNPLLFYCDRVTLHQLRLGDGGADFGLAGSILEIADLLSRIA